MKKIILVNTLLLFSVITNCQSIIVDYHVKYNQTIYENQLKINDSSSVWLELSQDENNNLEELFMLKDFIHNKLYYSDILFSKTFYIEDSLHRMSWKLTDDTLNVMGFDCNSATTTFRGRKYIAFYTANIPLSNGPWKFGGLPGLILLVKSIDNEYEFRATKYKNNKEDFPKDSYLTNHYISWGIFKLEFISTIDKVIKKIKSTINKDERGYLKIDAPEIIYPNVQTGKGIEY